MSDPSSSDWYYVGHYGQLGPLSLEQMVALVHDSVVDRDTYVWRDGMTDWRQARAVPELSSYFASMGPPPAPGAAPPPLPSPASAGWIARPGFTGKSDRSRLVGGLLNFIPGVGRMYLGHGALGILQLAAFFLTCGVSYVWNFVDALVILSGGVKYDGYGRRLED